MQVASNYGFILKLVPLSHGHEIIIAEQIVQYTTEKFINSTKWLQLSHTFITQQKKSCNSFLNNSTKQLLTFSGDHVPQWICCCIHLSAPAFWTFCSIECSTIGPRFSILFNSFQGFELTECCYISMKVKKKKILKQLEHSSI